MRVLDSGSEVQVVRRHYVFSLRDEVPAPKDGWNVLRHGPECLNVDGKPFCKGEECRASEICRLFLFDGQNEHLFHGLGDLMSVLGRLADRPLPDLDFGLSAIPFRRVVAAVGAPWRDGDNDLEHYERCISLLRDAIKALRISTGSLAPNFAIQRAWPLYAVVHEGNDGVYQLQNFVMVNREQRIAPTPTPGQVAEAENVLLATWSRHPNEVYRDFELGAQRAVEIEGDYVESVLKAAAAAEVLVKHAAWMLTWEATCALSSDPAPGISTAAPNSEAKPRDLIGKVLSPRLKGNWSSQVPQQAVGAWRAAIAKRRNAIIHLGYRPSAEEAEEAVEALAKLKMHILDRLALQAAVYPRTALFLMGRPGLERRAAFDKARATYRNQDLQELMSQYLTWLEQYLDLGY